MRQNPFGLLAHRLGGFTARSPSGLRASEGFTKCKTLRKASKSMRQNPFGLLAHRLGGFTARSPSGLRASEGFAKCKTLRKASKSLPTMLRPCIVQPFERYFNRSWINITTDKITV
jgi:uracil DNA glycosylase